MMRSHATKWFLSVRVNSWIIKSHSPQRSQARVLSTSSRPPSGRSPQTLAGLGGSAPHVSSPPLTFSQQHPHLFLRGEKLIPNAMETCRKFEWKARADAPESWSRKGSSIKYWGGSPGHRFFETNQSPCFKLLESHILTYQLPREAKRSSLPFFFSLKKIFFIFLFSLMC